MKKIVVGLLLFCSLRSAAQKDPSVIELPAPPDSTALGDPNGKPVSKEIGSEGGGIRSEDGRVELIFPAGAIMETKNISIQPTTNNAPNGTGKAYWFEPSGIQFKKPVQIIFHYGEEEAAECPPELMYLAIQNKTGKWSFADYEEMDTVSRTLKGTIHHFSGGANGYKLKLSSEKDQLCVKEKTSLSIRKYYKGFDFDIDTYFNRNQPVLWHVNGKEMGDRTVGHINAIRITDRSTGQTLNGATYTAPDYILRKNPVTISVDIYVYSGNTRVYTRSKTLKCNILVYDAYNITVIHKQEYRVIMGNELTDSSSFFVWVYPGRIVIDNIKNYPPFLTRSTRRGPCSLIIFTSGADGSLHLADGYRDLQISNDHPPEVLFRFLSTYEKTICRFSWVCPGMRPTLEENLREVPLAPEINFIANGNIQRINVNDNGTLYKLIIVPYRRNNN